MKQENNQYFYKILCIIINILKQWTIIVCAMLICAFGMDVFKTLTYKPMYVASATAIIETGKATYTEDEKKNSYGKTLDYIFDTQVVNDYVKENITGAFHPYRCDVIAQENANIVNINVTSDTKQSSFYSLKYILDWYQKNHKTYQLNYKLNIIEDISFQEQPTIVNNHNSNIKLGAIIGAMISIILLFIFYFVKSTVTNPKDIDKNIDSRLFSKIPRERKHRNKLFWKKNRKAILIDSMKTSFFYKEALKKLRHRLEESAKKHDYKTVLVTSTSENEGKSSVSANLAIGFGMKDYKVLLIDTDFRKPSLKKVFDQQKEETAYLNDYLEGHKKWRDVVVPVKKSNIDVIFTKKDLEKAESYCSHEKMQLLLEEAKKDYDFILVDSAPAGYLSDTIKLNNYCDCSLLVIKQNVVTFNQINNTIHRLTTIKNNLLGVVYNASIYQFRGQRGMSKSHYDYNRYYDRKRRG